MSKFDDLEKAFEKVVDKHLPSFPEANKTEADFFLRCQHYLSIQNEIDSDFDFQINEFSKKHNISERDKASIKKIRDKYEDFLIYGC